MNANNSLATMFAYGLGGLKKDSAEAFELNLEVAHATHPPPLSKSACSPSGVNDSYKTYCKTPVPLLVRFLSYVPSAVARNLLNLFKTKLKKHRFSEVKFRKVLLAPVPLTVVCVEIASLFAMCLKPKENQWILHAFLVLDGAGGA